MHRLPHYNPVALILLCLLSITNLAHALTPVEVAEVAKPATVGVYATVQDDKYYGTGVIISEDGVIITSTTVVPPEANSITIYFEDHTSLSAEIIEFSIESQSVLLKVKSQLPTKFPYLKFQKSLPVLGEEAYTLGNASNMIKLGDGVSFSAGVISGIYNITHNISTGETTSNLPVIETDASVNDGQDGGGLINSAGEIIGIISKEFSTLRWQGTAIPASTILNSFQYFKDKNNHFTVNTETSKDQVVKFQAASENIKSSLVAIKVERLYATEDLSLPEWKEYKSSITNWDALNSDEQRRMIIDYFSAENLVSANQMLRRPDKEVTGLMISSDGYIITSAFNVESSDTVYIDSNTGSLRERVYKGSIEALTDHTTSGLQKSNNRVMGVNIRLSDGRVITAEIIGFNLPLGLALLKADIADQATFFNLEDGISTPKLGEDIAILGVSGNSYTINTGIVSAPARNNGNYFQVDALLNYGNSGGPIIDSNGKILGLAARPLTPSPISGILLPFSKTTENMGSNSPTLKDFTSTPNSGISMGINAEKINATLPSLIAGEGITESPFITLGLYPAESDPYLTDVVVGRIKKNSPASRADFKVGDIIKSMDGIGIRSWSEINNYIAQKHLGDVVIFTIRRPLEKPYILLNGKKVTDEKDLVEFIKSNKDGEKVSGIVSSPEIEQKLYVTLKK